jgi:RHS repeat-associated protein
LLSFDGTSYTYDNNGNMTSRTDGLGTTTYQYNAENRLIGINKSGGTAIIYRYDPFGKRIEKNVNGTITRYLYDGEDILYELDGSNTILARYTHGPGVDEHLIVRRGGANYYYHADGLGSITHITDVSGNIVQTYVYNAFGEIVNQYGNLPNTFTYTSREYDPESGLYYYRARYYDSKIGRFLQTDPIGFSGGGVNLYAYVANNPVNFTDPFGLVDKEPPVIRMPVPDEPPIIRNPPPNYQPPNYPIPPGWYPPFPRSFCEMKCYLILFTDFYVCNIKWSIEHLEDPHTTCGEKEKQHNEECKRGAYNYYRRCINGCSK